jgi:hypothetical protein
MLSTLKNKIIEISKEYFEITSEYPSKNELLRFAFSRGQIDIVKFFVDEYKILLDEDYIFLISEKGNSQRVLYEFIKDKVVANIEELIINFYIRRQIKLLKIIIDENVNPLTIISAMKKIRKRCSATCQYGSITIPIICDNDTYKKSWINLWILLTKYSQIDHI